MSNSLHKGLKMRHMTMIALGGTIGAGLFVGSGTVIRSVGPAAIVSYFLAGLLVVLIMRMLGEMAVANPTLGSFAQYARTALGDWAGFSVGWLYWFFWVIVLGIEATASAAVLHSWLLPNVPQWLLSTVPLILLTLTNLVSVRAYGEFEYWFAFIKVATIVLFLVVGGLFILGVWPETHFSFENLTAHGGFAPHGVGVMFSGIITAVAAFIGAEIATIAATESDEPRKSVAKATSSVIWRVLIFYVGSIFVVVTIVPWNNTQILKSPYVSVMNVLHIPSAGVIINIVVLVAVLSCLNSGIYTSSRMLYAMANRGEAPSRLLDVNSRGVPVKAILFCAIIAYITVILAYVSPNAFAFLLNASGAVGLFIYLFIAVSQFKMRRKLEQEAPDKLIVKMWGFPYLTIICILAMIGVFISMAYDADTRSQLILSLISFVIVLAIYFIRAKLSLRRGGKSHPTNPDVVEDTEQENIFL